MRKTLACGRESPQKQKNKIDATFSNFLKEKLQAHIRANSLNQSESRSQILDMILELGGHFSTADLLRALQDRYPNIGTATVYRNLPIFMESGILRETLTDDQGLKVFEIADEDHHDHIVCLDCGEIFEFHDQAIEKAQDKLSQTLRFKPVHHKHVMYAHCSFKSKAE